MERSLFRAEPKRRWRAALRLLKRSRRRAAALEVRCVRRCGRSCPFGVRCEAPLWSANLPREHLLLGASRPLPRVRTKAALSRRTPNRFDSRTLTTTGGRSWSAVRPWMRASLSFWSAVQSTALVREPTTRTPARWSIPPAASCANQSGAVAPHSKNRAADAMESGAVAPHSKNRAADAMESGAVAPHSGFSSAHDDGRPLLKCGASVDVGVTVLLECGAKHRFGPRTYDANTCSLEHPARCLVCEPKRRCRAALQKPCSGCDGERRCRAALHDDRASGLTGTSSPQALRRGRPAAGPIGSSTASGPRSSSRPAPR